MAATNPTPPERPESKSGWNESDPKDLLEWAWGIIANVRDWEKESRDWQETVFKWRDAYFKFQQIPPQSTPPELAKDPVAGADTVEPWGESTPPEEWEEEFERLYVKGTEWFHGASPAMVGDFIRSLLHNEVSRAVRGERERARELREAAEAIIQYLYPSVTTDLVYLTPAMGLRRAADLEDARDVAIARLKAALLTPPQGDGK